MTNEQRAVLERLIQIKKEQDALQSEKLTLMSKAGYGTHRLKKYPGLIIKVIKPGWSSYVSWLSVARELARKLGMNEQGLRHAANGHRTTYNRRAAISIVPDKAKKPLIKAI